MPELPEVETIKSGLVNNLIGEVITSIKIYQPKLRWTIDSTIHKKLKNATIIDIGRRAKYLIIYTTKGNLIIHLGMSGSLLIKSESRKKEKHDHVIIHLNKLLLLYNDPRRFGCILFTTGDPLQHRLLEKLGPEPLSCNFNHSYFLQKIAKSARNIKTLIMDQKIVVGVGNIYACEALFLAKINPLSTPKNITENQIILLVEKIKETLIKSIRQGGTTLKDYKNIKGKPGYFSQSLYVYGRAGKKCCHCKSIIASTIISQRNSFYCPNCQEISSI